MNWPQEPHADTAFCTMMIYVLMRENKILNTSVVLYIYKTSVGSTCEDSPEICKCDPSRSCKVLEFCPYFPFFMTAFFLQFNAWDRAGQPRLNHTRQLECWQNRFLKPSCNTLAYTVPQNLNSLPSLKMQFHWTIWYFQCVVLTWIKNKQFSVMVMLSIPG